MTVTVYACERDHPAPVPAVAYDTYADLVVCWDHSGLGEEDAYSCEWVLHYIPDDHRMYGRRPAIEVEG